VDNNTDINRGIDKCHNDYRNGHFNN
jgi:hypothetical protein